MSWLFGILARARYLFTSWLIPPHRTEFVEESLPDKLKRRTLYVVREDGFDEQAALLCPCGCQRTLHLNLIPDERPCWRLTLHDNGTVTLYPSVWRKKGCGSHFWFRRGRIEWCREYELTDMRGTLDEPHERMR